MKAVLVEVAPREGFGDPAAEGALALARELGVPAERCSSAALYRLEGLEAGEAERLASELLADPVTETWRVEAEGARPPAGAAREGALIDVWLKPQVSDPVAPSVERGARDMGLKARVRCGRRFRLEGPVGLESARVAAFKAFANPVVHDCAIESL